MNNIQVVMNFDSAAEAAAFFGARDCTVSCCVGDSPATPAATVVKPDPVLAALNDPRFTLRSLNELAALSGDTADEILEMLDCNGIDYVRRTRQRDGAALIGLASRN